MAVIQQTTEKRQTDKSTRKTAMVLLAVFIAVVTAVVTIKLFGIRYQTNDDATLSNIAAGAYGDSLHMVYVNMLFSLMLRPLYAAVQTNWYVIIQLVLVVISIAVIIYLLMDKMGVLAGSVISTAVMVAFGQHIFYTFQYTEASFIMLTAGLLLIVHNLGDFNKGTLIGILLALMGSMVRWTSFYAVGAMSAPLLLYRFFRMDMEKKKKAVATMICLFTLTFGAKIVDVMFYKADAGWDEFTKYNAARTQYSDFKVLDLPEENPFREKGISDIDYKMLNSWDFYDEARFDTPLLEELSVGGQKIGAADLVIKALKQIKNMLWGKSYHCMFLLAVIITLLCLRPKLPVIPLLGMYGMFGVLMLYLTYEIRFPEWVELGLIWTTVIFGLYCCSDLVSNKKILMAMASSVLAGALFFSLPSYIELYETYQNYVRWTKEEQHYFDDMSSHKENIYLLPTSSINVGAGFDVFNPRNDNFYSNIVAYGGWLSRAPHRDAALHNYGLYRPLVDAVDKPNVYLGYQNIGNVELYVEQELGCEVYAIKTGENAFAPYQLVTELP